MSSTSVDTTIAALQELRTNPPKDTNDRLRLYNEIRRTLPAVESESNFVQRLMYGTNPMVLAGIAIDLKIFHILHADPRRSFTTAELAELTGAELGLLARVLRGLAAYDILNETDVDSYQASYSSQFLTNPGIEAGIRCHHHVQENFRLVIPDFLKKTEYKNPLDHDNTVWQEATGQTIWEWFAHNPEDELNFGKFMGVQRLGQRNWWDVLPVERIFSDAGSHDVAFVDIGGSRGHQTVGLKKAFPELPGQMIVQDLESLLSREPSLLAQLPESMPADERAVLEQIRFQPHDFFTEQPVKNAKVYYLRNILHDHADERCETILKRTHDAMGDGGVLMIDELVLPNKGATWQSIQMDITMMLLSSIERTRRDWESLLDRSGFVIEQIWTLDEETCYSVMLCRKK
ncbi:O-methyltransferase-like protein 2 [Elsinoe australis]|uniref:O-methyltransferase-like protein 2 n=1 Tax=Elsinoe australis TaxID=40998 RepID=A0A4U7BAQ8_9PEZI|nr:O-methyltransferase-like protein 2 [Elsinoe australis]